MIRSFRLRLALFSALLTGLALAAFGIGIWYLVGDSKIRRIDNEVRTYAEREAARTRDPAEWARIEARLVSDLGVRDSKDLLLLVQDKEGANVYRSAHWPTGLDAAHLPWPKQKFAKPSGGLGSFLISEARAALTLSSPASGRGSDPSESLRFAQRESDPHSRADQSGEQNDRPPRSENRPREERDPLRPPPPGQPSAGAPPVSTTIAQDADGRQWRIGLASSDRGRAAVAIDAQVIDADMNGMRKAYLIAMPLALLLIGFGGWAFSSRALRPLEKLTAATRRVTAEGLDQRISGQGEDREFVELIDVYNGMLARLESSFRQAHRFSADAAHELKTPLAILQGQLERAIDKCQDSSPMQIELTSILDEVRRLSTISRKLLLLSQADAGRLNVYREPFDLSKTLADLVEDTRMLAPELQITGEIHPGMVIHADGGLLRQVLHNLVSNAIKYNIARGWIRISTSISATQVEIVVTNSSPGIPLADQEKIFERFYRVDAAHSRQVEGVGLGLSVSREIARAHGGDITLKAGSDGNVQFYLILPATK
jgi:heavy metal sensor kinase